MRSWEWGPHDVINVLIREVLEWAPFPVPPSSPCHVRSQGEGGNLQIRKRAVTRTGLYWCHDLRVPASRIGQNSFLLLKPPSLWYHYGSPSRPILNCSLSFSNNCCNQSNSWPLLIVFCMPSTVPSVLHDSNFSNNSLGNIKLLSYLFYMGN